MSTPSRSQSSTMGSKCYFGWRESMERRQRENDQQMRNAEFPLAHMMRSEEEFSPNHEVQLDEIFDSTQVSTKRRCDRRSRLSDAMQVGLGP
ncbi:hypothetical protein CK203_117261 [Vitis vinifera]|uniref:Uncharacterized protein n=1 Tax=Vitis vinifera TaxID=29760 RepID=A0A438FCT5_VITVI|nr:hypothetical protein CK203_117261 [Vitis vinifera]